MGLGLEEKPSRLPSGFSKATPEACPATGVSTGSALEIVKIFHPAVSVHFLSISLQSAL